MRITANQVTFSRLILMPGLCAMLYGDRTMQIVAVILGTIVGCTDFVDGYLARKHGPTVLGGLMDPIADKVFIAVAFLPFADRGWTPWALVAAIFLREFLVTAMRSSFERRHQQLRSSYLAKVKTWVQMVGIGLLLFALVIESRAVMFGILGGFTVLPLVGWLVFRLKRGRSWTGALIGGVSFGGMMAVYAAGGAPWLIVALFVAIVGITWASGIDYLVLGVRELARRGDLAGFDVVRLLGAAALPVVSVYVLVHAPVLSWAVIALVSLELAHGGLDNLLAHHGAAMPAWAWGLRVLGATALLGAALLLPAHAAVLSILAVSASFAGTAVAFVKDRRYYLEEQLREKKRAPVPAASA
jgi:cardiolipin synthase (CMP-forming)